MPNKTHNYKVDVLPDATDTYNLGNASKKWKINGVTPGNALEKSVDTTVTSSSTNLPTSQAVASYVASEKDVREYDDYDDFPLIGAAGNIYVDKTTNNLYRWDLSAYEQVGGGYPTAITDSEIDALFPASI